MFFAWNKINKS